MWRLACMLSPRGWGWLFRKHKRWVKPCLRLSLKVLLYPLPELLCPMRSLWMTQSACRKVSRLDRWAWRWRLTTASGWEMPEEIAEGVAGRNHLRIVPDHHPVLLPILGRRCCRPRKSPGLENIAGPGSGHPPPGARRYRGNLPTLGWRCLDRSKPTT